MAERIRIERFGRDHWSLMLYIGGRDGERPDPVHMRTNPRSHSAFAVRRGSESHDTRLASGKAEDHDDWDCADDLAAAGLLKKLPVSGVPAFSLTDSGRDVFSRLRAWKAGRHPLDQFSHTAAESRESAESAA